MPRCYCISCIGRAICGWSNLGDNPGWYTDEGSHLDIVRHLLDGRVQYLAINQSTLLFSRLPLFEGLFAVWARLFGISMAALRALTGMLGTLSVGILYGLVRSFSRDRRLALIAAFLFAIYPPAVLYSRFGFSYNLLVPLMLIAIWGLYEYSALHSERNGGRSSTSLRSAQNASAAQSKNATRWLAMSAFAIGLGAISDVWAWVLIVPFVIIVLIRNWRDLLWSVLLLLLPIGVYALIMLTTVPQAFLFDLQFVLSRLNQLSIAQQIQTLWQNVTTLSAQDNWFWIGALGLLALRPARVRWIVLAFAALPFVLLGRTTALFSLSYYYMIPLLPLIALGVANLIARSADWLARGARQRLLLAIGLAGIIGLVTLPPLLQQVMTRFRTDIDPFLIDASSAQQAAAFVNERVTSADLVIASPAIAWQIRSDVADFQMSIAYGGQATPHLPANVPADRWVFDPDYRRARFVIIDNLWRNWAMPNVPGVTTLLREIEAWRAVFHSGEITVYQNPEG